ncbi:peptidylprolyl isomerase [Paenibacillus tarimensis]
MNNAEGNGKQEQEGEVTSTQSEQTTMPGEESSVKQAGKEMNRPAAVWMGVSFVLLFLLILTAIFGPVRGGGTSSEAVAKVNGITIGKDALYESLVETGGDSALESLIVDELLRQEMEKAGYTLTESDIEEELAEIKSDYSSDEEFQSVLQQYGMTEKALLSQIRINAQMKKLLEPQIEITEEVLQDFYEQNKDNLATPEEVRASHILVETQEEAEKILEQLKQGADFASLAAENSTDTVSKDNGGDVDFFSRGEMMPEFEEAAFALETGQLSDIVETDYGFHIIKATDRRESSVPAYEDAKEELRENYLNEEMYNRSGPWLEEIRSAATIENYLNPAS